MSTAQAIYDRIAADPVLFPASPGVSLIGTYAVPGQATRPALAVWMQNEKVPEKTVITGIEVTIAAVPENAEEWCVTGEVNTNPTFRIYAAQWTAGAGASARLQAVRNRLIRMFPGSASTPLAAAGLETLGVLDQVVITWTDVDAQLEALF